MGLKNLGKTSCKHCDSSDAVEQYLQEDGQINGHCFSCGKKNYFTDNQSNKSYTRKMYNNLSKEDVSTYPYREQSSRSINPIINKRYGIRISSNESTGEIDSIYYPYFVKNILSGYKIRKLPKDFDCSSAGSIKNADPFGWHLIDKENKRLIITEGEEDVLPICEVLWEATKRKRFPNVISLKDGAMSAAKLGTKYLKELENFERIIVCFDNDKEGQSALTQLSLLINPHKLYVMQLNDHDASDAFIKGKKEEIKNAYLNAQPFKPEGVVTVSEARGLLQNEAKIECVSFPKDWSIFNKRSYGMRFSEFHLLTAAPSVGKTQIIREIVYDLLANTKYNIGMISLEETLKETNNGLRSIFLNKRMHLPEVYDTLTDEEKTSSWDFIEKDNRLSFYKHSASFSDENILSAIRTMATLNNCKFIFLDHIGMIIGSNNKSNNDVKAIDSLLVRFRELALQLDIFILAVVHVSRSPGKQKDFSKGDVPSQHDLRGSGALEQFSNAIYALQRNISHSNPEMRNVMCLHIVKGRFAGTAGDADYLYFNSETGRLMKISKPSMSLREQGEQRDNEWEI